MSVRTSPGAPAARALFLLVSCVWLCVLGDGSAGAQPRPLPEGLVSAPDAGAARFVAQAGPGGNTVVLVDTRTGRMLIGGANLPFVVNTPMRPAVRVIPRPEGFDIVVHYANEGGEPLPLGRLVIDGIRLDRVCRQWTFGQDTQVRTIPGYAWYNQNRYPGDWYSPVMVSGDEGATLGFQLLYPATVYDHTVLLAWLGANLDTPNPNWSAQFDLEGMLPAGQAREYTLAVRAAAPEQSFMHTLAPYRDYFRGRYGEVKYRRDTRPVIGEAAAAIESVGPDNPQGWAPANLRPDLFGWSPWVEQILARRRLGYQRFMMWTPSGVFGAGNPLNFPWRFMTPISEYPDAIESLTSLQRVRSSGMQMGFWWGNASTLMRGWGPTVTAEAFDPRNGEHLTLAYRELDLARAAGAKIIGLDAFKMRSPANMQLWLRLLRQRAPGVTFVTENAAPDFIHNICPTFHEARDTVNPHLLADLLNPGHETWIAIQSTAEAVREGRPPTPPEIEAEIRRVAALGGVPLLYGPHPLPVGLVVADTWLTTVPPELQPDQRDPRRRGMRAP